ncbi:MAG: hypothetical protein ABWX96_21315 [Propionibacteriaceae bacterium]
MTATPSGDGATTTRSPRSTTLAQMVAVRRGAKARAEKILTGAYHTVQKAAPLAGLSRTYQPRDELGEALPPEVGQVQVRVDDVLSEVAESTIRLLDVVATVDRTNCTATGDIVVLGSVLMPQVPVTHLMWLEKQLVNLRTFVSKLPVLDTARQWIWDDQTMAWRTEPIVTTRTKKVPRNHIKYEATNQHPAQVETYLEDIVVGYWTRIDYSGALPTSEVNAILGRVDLLIDAVRRAREQANAIAADTQDQPRVLVEFLLGDYVARTGFPDRVRSS